jgi:isochorismate hydrolase
MDVFFTMDATAAFTEQMHLASLLNLSCGFATPIAVDQIPLRTAIS